MRPPGRDGTISEVLIEYDGPQCFVMVDEGGSKYMGLHTVSGNEGDNWLYIKVDDQQVRQASRNDADLRDIFDHPADGKYDLVTVHDDSHATSKVFSKKSIPEEFLPERRTVTHLEQRDAQLGATRVSMPRFTNADIERFRPLPSTITYPTPMWETSPEAIEYIKSIRTPLHVVANATGRLVCDMLINPDERRFDVSLTGLGGLLSISQKLFDALALSPERTPERGPLPTSPATRLSAVASFPSSFGLRIETHNSSLLADNDAAVAAKNLLSVIATGDDLTAVRATFEKFGRRAGSYYAAFVSSLHKLDASFGLEIGIPGGDRNERGLLSRSQIISLRRFFETNSEILEQELAFKGRLVAVNLPAKFFRLENDDGEAISGRISDAAIPQVKDKRINALHDARVLNRIEFDEASGAERNKVMLLELQESS